MIGQNREGQVQLLGVAAGPVKVTAQNHQDFGVDSLKIGVVAGQLARMRPALNSVVFTHKKQGYRFPSLVLG